VVVPRPQRLAARKLWIAFAVGASGTVVVDAGARRALEERGVSLLPAGVLDVHGGFDADDAVEIAGPDGTVFAKGLVRHPAGRLKELAGRRTSTLPAAPGGGPAAGPPTSRPTYPTRWCIATTWSSYREMRGATPLTPLGRHR
jgi:glutamate 5-kinase